MYSNTPKIVGAGNKPKKLTKKKKKITPKPKQAMPYYPSTGSNQRPGGMTDDMKTKISSRIQAWQDRNISNRGRKLNP